MQLRYERNSIEAILMDFFRSEANKKARLPFSDAVRVGDVVYLSGQLGILPGTTTLVSGGIEAEAKQMMENIAAVLSQVGLGWNDVFKCLVMLSDMANWPRFNRIYLGFFSDVQLPTRSAFGANGLALGAAVEMECWAKARSTA